MEFERLILLKRIMSEEYWRRLLEQNGKMYRQNVNSIKSILNENRGFAAEIPTNEHVLLLFSGGMDSTILVDLIVRKWNCKIIFLYFRRNARNQIFEEESVDFFFDFYKKRFPDNVLELQKLEIEIPSRVNKEYLDRDRQNIMGLPLRNSTMWDNSFAQAVFLSGKHKTTIRTIVVGSVKEDETSPESGILSILAYNLHICISMGVWYYQLLAPFIDGTMEQKFSKIDLLQYAKQFQIPIEKTRSCFGDNKKPCDSCLACQNRNNAYKEFNLLVNLKENKKM